MLDRPNYDSVDLAKFIGAFLVIALSGLAFDSKNINSVLYYLIISAITLIVAFVILLAYKKLNFAKFLKYIM
ncbi:MAG: hypothetical protein VZQ55_00015 [Ruminococcus sp.]|nr:hypothetical protein [Ruminococcus sp.]